MLGRAVSSSTPTDLQPSSTMGLLEWPLMNCHGITPGPTFGCPYCAVGMHSASESSIGLPSIATKALRMAGFVTPPDVSRSFMTHLGPLGRTWAERGTSFRPHGGQRGGHRLEVGDQLVELGR